MKMFIKSRIAWTISALFLVAVTSCSKDEPAEQSPSAGQILFTGEQAGLTVKSALIANNSDFVADAGSTLKTTLNGNVTSWINGTDKTGIYCTEATIADGSGTPGIVNDQYTANTTGPSSWFTALTAMFWGAAITPHHFYAYYPFTTGSPAAATVPVGLISTQTQSAANNFDHIGGLDFLVATPIAVTSPANTNQTISGSGPNEVHLTYNHLFSILEFDIAGTGNIYGIRLRGTDLALAGSYVDITQSTPVPGFPYTLANGGTKTGTVIVDLTTHASLTATATATKVYMVILPGSDQPCFIEFKNFNGDYVNTLDSKTAPSGGFLRGQKYVVTVNAGTL